MLWNILNSLGELPREFWAGLALGCFATFLFAVYEFDKPTFEKQAERPETSFAPQELTTRREYMSSFLLYVVGLEFVYLAVCIIGPAPFLGAGADDSSFEDLKQVPLWVALVLIGILPRVPIIAFVEQAWRRFMHERASIPQAALSLSRELWRAEYDFTSFRRYVEERHDHYRFVSASDFEADQLSPSHRWARLSAILWQVEFIETDPALEDFVDLDFVNRHRAEFDAICYSYRQLAERIQNARAMPEQYPSGLGEAPAAFASHSVSGENAGHNGPISVGSVPDEFAAAIESLLRRICIFLACALIAKTTSRRALVSALLTLGFTPSKGLEQFSDIDLVIKAFASALGASFLLLVVSSEIGVSQTDFKGWPATPSDVFALSFSLFLMHGSAIFAALTIRRYFRHQLAWFGGTIRSPQMPSAAKYLALFLACYLVASVVVTYWYGAWIGKNQMGWQILGKLAPLALVPAWSALFACLLLDCAQAYRTRWRLWAIALSQAVVTALFAYIGTKHAQPELPGSILFGTLLAGTFALVFGASTSALLVRQPFSAAEAEEANA